MAGGFLKISGGGMKIPGGGGENTRRRGRRFLENTRRRGENTRRRGENTRREGYAENTRRRGENIRRRWGASSIFGATGISGRHCGFSCLGEGDARRHRHHRSQLDRLLLCAWVIHDVLTPRVHIARQLAQIGHVLCIAAEHLLGRIPPTHMRGTAGSRGRWAGRRRRGSGERRRRTFLGKGNSLFQPVVWPEPMPRLESLCLSQSSITSPQRATPVSCISCHQGRQTPSPVQASDNHLPT